MLDRYMDRLEKIAAGGASPFPGMFFPGENADGASMSQNVKITAESFEDLSAVLKRFSEAAKGLATVPDSLFIPGVSSPIVTPRH